MLYPLKYKHVHPDFKHLDCLKITVYDPQLRRLYNNNRGHSILVEGKEYEQNPLDFIKVKDIDCTCDGKVLYEQLFGDPDDQIDEVMAYKSCKHTIFAAAKRQMKMAPRPDPQTADDFLEYAKEIINAEVGDHLRHFSYSYQQWYNHLNKAKQNDMDNVSRYYHHEYELLDRNLIKKIERNHYEGICKVELQGTDGKPRMVCSIPLKTKYIMGPICWRLEEIFADHFKGYCGGKNLTQMADTINKYIDLGFTNIIEGDGSAFDNTQDITLKRVDHYIYEQVKHAVYHVDRDEFIKTATEVYKTMDVITMKDKKRSLLFTYSILGSVFSGDCDTTLCNTIRMALYNRYVNDRAGLKYGVDYVCFSKGDDFTVMYKPYIKYDHICNIYYKYFVKAIKDVTKPDSRVFGLGQVLKMLDQGDQTSIKFCSLRAWLVDESHIMLTRDPKKFYNLSKYSRKIKCMNNIQAAQYCLDQAVALEMSYSKLKIFEAMAHAYRVKADEYLRTVNKQQVIEFKKKYESRLARQAKLNQRAEASRYEMAEDKYQRLIYNINYRKTSHKISDDYWTSLQAIERVNTRVLTDDEARNVNRQIEEEFSVNDLYMSLGLKNRSDEK